MTERRVELTEELDAFVSKLVRSGHYADASEVVREALQKMEECERVRVEKLAALRAAIDEGFESGVAAPGVFDRVRARAGLGAMTARTSR